MSVLKKDLVVIGSGPGGYVGAVRASQLGLSVAIVEKDGKLGGTCLLRGCIPTKAMLHSADLLEEIRHAGKHGIQVDGVTVDFPGVMKRKQLIVDKSAAGVNYLMKKNKVEVVKGLGRVDGPGRVTVTAADGTTTSIEARFILLATGSVPRVIPGVAVDGKRVVTSDEILELTEVPESLIVLGAGAVGVEFASVYSRLGSQCTVVELLPRMLPIEDEEISKEFEKIFKKRGVDCLVDTRMSKVETTEKGVRCTLQAKSGEESTLEAAMLLVAVGRAPYVDGLGAKEAGVNVDERGFVPVNDYYETNVPGIYAIGDIIPTPQLAHVASAEAMVATEHMAAAPTRPINYLTTPSCTYSEPEVASVGLSEAAAKEAGYDVAVGKFPFSASGKARILEATEGFVKIVSEKQYDQVLGVHIIGPKATELIAEAGLMLQTECTTEEVSRLMHAHPTISEAVMEAAHGVHGSPVHI
ncbi:MAG: dihydrolipoyl dehydrogenase [Gemmatimonadota bacterium]|nr:MAG: dihydrolipoyl dehydrogenase [Gemmatimonadota bacterium]